MSRWTKQITDMPFEYCGEAFRADVDVDMYSERNYGADADGNRGIYRAFIEGIDIDRVSIDGGADLDLNRIPETMKEAIRLEVEDMDLSEVA